MKSKAIFSLICLAFLPLFGETFCPPLKDFTQKQKKILVDSYNYGQREGLGLVLAAIAWHESCAGRFNINFADPSAGPFHIHLPNALRDKNLSDNAYNRNVIGQLLINDFDYSSKLALNELLLWRAQHKGNLKNMIKSYNKGNSWRKDKKKNALAEQYYQGVDSKMSQLELYIPILLAENEKIKNEARSEKIKSKSISKLFGDGIDEILEELSSGEKSLDSQSHKKEPKFVLLEER